MLTRRHIRVKVMQSLYAFWRNENGDTAAVKRFLHKSMADMYDLFLLDLSLMIEIKEHAKDYLEKSKSKHLATAEDINPNLKFVENALLNTIDSSEKFQEELEERKLSDWRKQSHYVHNIWETLKNSELYKEYTVQRKSSFQEDKKFVIDFFKTFIAPNEEIHNYLEDQKLTWMDDMPIVNTTIVKLLQKFKDSTDFILPRLFKNEDDRDFAFDLFNKTIMYNHDFEEDIAKKTPNWDKDRLATIDSTLIKMALCEFTFFPTIPVKVTINEYLEVAKEYSTPKSSKFINGVLDKISKDYQKEGKLNKSGRGLL